VSISVSSNSFPFWVCMEESEGRGREGGREGGRKEEGRRVCLFPLIPSLFGSAWRILGREGGREGGRGRVNITEEVTRCLYLFW